MSEDTLHDQQLADILAELTDAVCRGDVVDFDAVCRQHPELAAELRNLWGAVLVTDATGIASDQGPVVAEDGSSSTRISGR